VKISSIETPALIIDVNIMKRNAEKMKELLSGGSLSLRPHYKSHKSAAIARWQIENGAIGMTCAKLSEAIDLADSGIEDILIANQITDDKKIRRLADLAGDCRLTVCIDDMENAKKIAEAAKAAKTEVHYLVEYDIGMERCGVTTKEEVLALAKLSDGKNLIFDGIQAYAGHISHEISISERKAKTAESYRKIKELIAYLNSHGVEVKTVSGGSTGTAEIKRAEGLYTEIQAGSYLFMDSTYRELDTPFENSLFLLSTVVSKRDGLTVIDAGVKTCGVDQGMPMPTGGVVSEIVASEEHFQLHGYTGEEKIGDKLMLIPAHCCSTVNLHDKIYLVDNDKVVGRIQVTARTVGK
jgi:3-hydroxy-D-aspartate aldolase